MMRKVVVLPGRRTSRVEVRNLSLNLTSNLHSPHPDHISPHLTSPLLQPQLTFSLSSPLLSFSLSLSPSLGIKLNSVGCQARRATPGRQTLIATVSLAVNYSSALPGQPPQLPLPKRLLKNLAGFPLQRQEAGKRRDSSCGEPGRVIPSC